MTLTFRARGAQIWRVADDETGEMLVATAVDGFWAREIAKTMRLEDVHCASCDGHACEADS